MIKDPDDQNVPVNTDWTARLPAGVTVDSSTWIIALVSLPDGTETDEDPLTVGEGEFAPAISEDGTATSCRLSGGTPGAVYSRTNRVTMTNGAQRDRRVFVVISDG